jgi:DNA-binding MurR/RpiR family transcriptional regulator
MTTNIQYLQSLSAPATHVAFIISRTGENRQLIEMARNLRKQKESHHPADVGREVNTYWSGG